MFSTQRLTLLTLSLAAQVVAGCSDPTGSVGTQKVETPAPVSVAAPVRVIEVGQSVTGRIKPADSSCAFFSESEGWVGLCNAFLITVPETGTLMTLVHWQADAPLAFFAKSSDRDQLDLACCASPVEMQLPVEAGKTYRLEVAYVGRPAAYPNITPVEFILETALRSTDAQLSRVVNAYVFGDDFRTQHLSQARITVVEGASAGAVASFNPSDGLYTLTNVPSGFVTLEIAADGFVPITKRVGVGSNIPYAFVLTRTTKLQNATSTLWGVAWVGPGTAYNGVKVEILDGALAGAFTFTDEFFGEYYFAALPAGPMTIRVSHDDLKTQILTVQVSGNTRFDLFMERK